MKKTAFVLALVLRAAVAGAQETAVAEGQQTERLWMPEGYRLITMEERAALPPEEMKAIGAKNSELLQKAVRAASPEERQAIAASMEAYGRTHELSQVEKQYVTMTSMSLLAATSNEQTEADKAADRARFEKLLKDQEEATRGFPDDVDAIQREVWEIDSVRQKEDRIRLYLRALKVLRPRPWNDPARWIARRAIEQDTYAHWGQATSLYDAALAFVRARQAEAPAEGAWFSMEGRLRLTIRGELEEAKRLFSAAVARNSRDLDSRIFPLLIAKIEKDDAEVARLLPRAREAWPKEEDFDRVLFDHLGALPGALQVRARETFEKQYRAAHPSDWDSRYRKVFFDAANAQWAEVERETTQLLQLPASTLGEPDRTKFFAMKLRAKASQGRCDEVAPEVARFEAAAELAYPRDSDPDAPPRARTADDARKLRAMVAEQRRQVARMRAAIADGSLERSPEWSQVPKEERRARATEMLDAAEGQLRESESVLRDRDDAAAAVEWSRRELAGWQTERGIPPDAIGDLAGRAERLSIDVRSALGRCLLGKKRYVEAVRVLSPCVGSGRYAHPDCVAPIVDAAKELVAANDLKEATAVYELLKGCVNYRSATDDLSKAIEKARAETLKPQPVSIP